MTIKRHWVVVFAFAIMAVYLKTTGSMIGRSGDAASIWETIKSLPTGNIVSSYVLYKGVFSVYPYVWLYQLSLFFGLSDFFFIKLFHCTLFAYVSAIGFPYIVESFLGKSIKSWRKLLFVIVVFWLWKSTLAFSQLMVDLPSMAYFIMLVNSAVTLSRKKESHTLLRYIYTGILVGISMALSGQYSIAALTVLLYILIHSYPNPGLEKRRSLWKSALCLTSLFAGIILIRGVSSYFDRSVVDMLRARGEWLPDGRTWLSVGFWGRNDEYRWGAGPTLIDYRGLSILKDVYGDQFDTIVDQINQGSLHTSIPEYFKLVARYPFDYLVKYFNRLFLSLSPDGAYASVSHLSVAYTLLFVSLVSIKKRVRKVGDFFRSHLLLILSFVFAIIAIMILCVEPRYVLQIQGLVYAFAIMDDTLWDGFRSFGLTVKEAFNARSFKILKDKPFPYVFLIYLLFLFLCLSHMGSLYETMGVNPSEVLFRF